MVKALLVVDVQNDFCPGGSLPVADGHLVASRISDWLRTRGQDYRVLVATMDWHPVPGSLPGFEHFSAQPDYATTWPPHCVQGTKGAQLHPNLVLPEHGVLVVRKGQTAAAYSGFEGSDASGTPLADILRSEGVDTVDVVGLATDYCVRATALDAVALGLRVRVLTDLVAGIASESIREALSDMRAAGVDLAESSDLPDGRGSGYRTMEHTADVMVEAWGSDLVACLQAAARGLIADVVDPASARVVERRQLHLQPEAPEDLLVRLLDEIVFLLDADPLVPIDAEVAPAVDGGLDVIVHLAHRDSVFPTGAVPKGVSRSDLAVDSEPAEVRCRFIVDV